ncbi:hypothetical protein CC86DRAFT_282940 [Ophiobolus disseminans]|uniref:Uncharacterized protein n=1 Tax=Ophiobolus disseminans TaxID=1469910 RepID=A0A6A7AEW4_9PLEO|nr:hypothetical protein CC86DRAFT_282940 [Ophiobolus disseminans]
MDDERLSDDLAAWACFRLDRLQPGLRILHLYDANGVVTKGVLLVRIRKTVFPLGRRFAKGGGIVKEKKRWGGLGNQHASRQAGSEGHQPRCGG